MGAKKGKGKGKGKGKKKKEVPPVIVKKEEPKPKPIIVEDPIPVTTHLAEMEETIEMYNKELMGEIYEETPITYQNFKKNFIFNLQKTVHQLNFIKGKRLKYEETEKAYLWYMEKMKAFEKLKSIDTRTSQLNYQNFPKVDTIKKSDYYEARNFPINFEYDHRDGNIGTMPPKDYLKQFQVRRLTKKEEAPETGIDTDYFGKERPFTAFEKPGQSDKNSTRLISGKTSFKDRLQSATTAHTNTMMKTANTSFTNLAGNLFEQPHRMNIIHEEPQIEMKKDIKAFYSTYKPKYNDENLRIEKLDMDMKNKQLKEKRFIEETKDLMNEWGISRSKNQEDFVRKREMRKIVEIFEEKFRKEEEEAKLALEKRLQEKKNTRKGLIVDDEDEQDEQMDKGKDEDFDGGDEGEEEVEHVVTNKIKNTQGEGEFLLKKNKEVVQNIKIKSETLLDKEKLQIDIMLKNEKLPNEMKPALSLLNPIINTRSTYGKNRGLNEIDNPKDGYKYHYHPMSIMDEINKEEIYSEAKFKKRPLTGINFKPVDKIMDDYLDKRKEISSFRREELVKLKDTLLGKDIHIPLTNLENTFLPADDKIKEYPKVFMPRPGTGLLPKTIIPVKKKSKSAKKSGASGAVAPKSAKKSGSKPKSKKKK